MHAKISEPKPKRVLGIDESGRGPVIGPLVMCGFVLEEGKLEKLDAMGVKDSKLLSPVRRSFLYKKLKELAADLVVLKMSAADIDRLRSETNLNKLEISRMCQIINVTKPDKIIIDAIEANTDGFYHKILHGLNEPIREKIKAGEVELVCENFADKNHRIVGAASIIAKVIRDAEVRKLAERYGDLGSGYPSDPKTIAFLKSWIEKHKELPPFVRHSWLTAKELKKNAQQVALKEFVETDVE